MINIIESYKKNINKYYFENNPWLFEYCRSMIEKLCIEYKMLNPEDKINSNKTLKIIKHICSKSAKLSRYPSICKTAFKYANWLKHSSIKKVTMESVFVTDFITNTNAFVSYLLNINVKLLDYRYYSSFVDNNDYFDAVEDIVKTYKDSDSWIYVKLNSFIEVEIKKYYYRKYFNVDDYRDEVENTRMESIVLILKNDKNFAIYNELYFEINSKANLLKHHKFFSKKVKFINDEVDNYLNEVEKFISHINNKNFRFFYKDENLKPIKIGFFGDYAGNGFQIHGLTSKKENCQHKEIFSLIYNFLIRSKKFKKSTYIKNYEINKGVVLNDITLGTYELYILVLFEYGFFNDTNNEYNVSNIDKIHFEAAFYDILHTASNLSILCNVDNNLIKKNIRFNKKIKPIDEIAPLSYLSSSIMRNHSHHWEENSPKYNIDINNHLHITILEEFLLDFFGFKSFRNGQLESIVKQLNEQKNSLTILPTGQGKSLIFYFVSMLINGPSFIISPTNILIEDQIRNLDELFSIDSVIALIEDDFSGYSSLYNYKFIYCTCDKILVEENFEKLANEYKECKFSQIIIDEIHTVSNWSHDFNPDISLLSLKLLSNFDRSPIRGYTATATYKVVKDICLQFQIDFVDVISTKNKISNKISFNCIERNNENFSLAYHNIIDKICNDNEKVIIFTNSIEDSIAQFNNVNHLFNNNSSIILDKGTKHYHEFVYGEKNILFTDHTLGVGINLPFVRNVIHYDLPSSLSQYIQEIGRANRSNTNSNSFIFYYPINKLSDYAKTIIRKEYSFSEYNNILHVLTNVKSKCPFLLMLMSVLPKGFKDFDLTIKKSLMFYDLISSNKIIYNVDQENINYLYVFKKLMIIKDFRLFGDGSIEVVNNSLSMFHIKEALQDYLKSVDAYDLFSKDIHACHSYYDIIKLYYKWWFNEYIFFVSEEISSVFSLMSNNYSNVEIQRKLDEYLSISILDINEIISNDYYNDLNIILELKEIEILNIKNSIYQALLNRYNPVYDLILFISDLYENNENMSRLRRSLLNFNVEQKKILLDKIDRIYSIASKFEVKMSLLNVLFDFYERTEIINTIYTNRNKDEIYNLFLIMYMNKL